jgi:hypothetical protein
MTVQKALRMPDDLAARMKLDSEQKNLSENDWVLQAIDHFLECKRLDTTGQMRMIVLRYPGTCLKCGKEVKSGEWALYGRGIGIICMDDYIQRIGDKALLAKYLKVREYDRIIKALKLEAERLAENVEFGQIAEKIDVLYKMNSEIHKALMEYFNALGTEAEREKLDYLLKRSEELYDLIRAIQEFILAHRIKPIEKKKEKPAYET